jgi:hypothetical protein
VASVFSQVIDWTDYFLIFMFGKNYFFVCDTGVGSQGLMLARQFFYCLSRTPALSLVVISEIGSCVLGPIPVL